MFSLVEIYEQKLLLLIIKAISRIDFWFLTITISNTIRFTYNVEAHLVGCLYRHNIR